MKTPLNIHNNIQLIFFSTILYGLSIAIFLKEINLLLFPNSDFKIMIIYRILIIVSSLLLFLYTAKKLNWIVGLLIILNIIFLFNFFFGEKLNFNLDIYEYFNKIGLRDEIRLRDLYLHNIEIKKFLLINIFNIILPLFVLTFTKLNIDFDAFKRKSINFLNYFLTVFFIFLIYRYQDFIINFDGSYEIKAYFINIHSMIYILNIYFLLLIDEYFTKDKKNKKIFIFKMTIILICFFLTDSLLHLGICSLTLIFYWIKYFKINLTLFLIFITIICLFILNDYVINQNDINQTGSILNSVLIRVKLASLFLFNISNLNVFFGNDLLNSEIYTYPHNLLVDVIICTGFFGLLIFSIIFYNFFKLFFTTKKNFILFMIVFQSFILSNLSGFLFTNIIFNIALASCFCFEIEKEEKIK